MAWNPDFEKWNELRVYNPEIIPGANRPLDKFAGISCLSEIINTNYQEK
jgi:hypothetical protein